jgi:hypothetical protein
LTFSENSLTFWEMIRRSPCEVYLKYLVSHPERKSTETIRKIIRAQHLDYPSDEYVNDLRDQMRVPTPFKPEDRLHNRSFNFLTRHQILGFYHPDEHCMLAHRFMLHSPRAKELIESLAIAGERATAIAHRLKTTNIRATSESVQRYLAFYWDLGLVDTVELNALLRMRFEYLEYRTTGGDLTPLERLQKDALKRASYADPRLAMAKMASTPMAGILQQMRMGFMPTKADLSKMASAVRIAAVARAFETMFDGRPEAASAGQGYALIAKLMGEIIEDVGDPDATLQSQLQQLAVKTETEQIPTLRSLSAGHHTTDMGPRVVEGKATKGELNAKT